MMTRRAGVDGGPFGGNISRFRHESQLQETKFRFLLSHTGCADGKLSF